MYAVVVNVRVIYGGSPRKTSIPLMYVAFRPGETGSRSRVASVGLNTVTGTSVGYVIRDDLSTGGHRHDAPSR